ncbi:MAG: protease complex subunit PrcB family protein [Dethiobacter sp.]|jgi:hypothetical protein|nr:MAG: protease complex subunit PrcB family protein [Dethiobacter sp.]
MKRLFIVFLTIATALLFAGCGTVNKPGATEPLEYEIVEETDSLPQDISGIIEHLKIHRGYFVFTPQDYDTGKDIYLLISSGEKPTGGYTIEVDSLIVQNGALKITVEERKPAKEDLVIQVLTYPFVVVKIFDSYENYNIINKENIKFEEISSESIPLIIEKSGKYVGQIDNNFIEIEVDGKAMSFMISQEFSPFLELLNTGDNILFSYYENANGQLEITNLNNT